VIWELGPVASQSDAEFHVILTHKGDDGDMLTNAVDVFAEYDWEEENNHAEADVYVGEGQPDLFINKWRDSEDPAHGGTFLYQLQYGNNGPVQNYSISRGDIQRRQYAGRG
jgi:hypothetical protein